MDEGTRIGLYGCMVIAAIAGVVIAIEHRRRPHVSASMGGRLLYLLFAVAVALGEADTVRGFVVVLTSSVGAYKIARTVMEPVAERLIARAS